MNALLIDFIYTPYMQSKHFTMTDSQQYHMQNIGYSTEASVTKF
jgi:hypothetical protein